MENLDANELIERYLDGSLPAAEQAAVETRLATDDTFRAEVELHRQLHAEFADARKLQLRVLLEDIVRETPPAVTNYGWLKGVVITLAVLLAIWLGWHLLSPGPTPVPRLPEEIKSTPAPAPEMPSAPSVSVAKAPKGPVAMADPAAFTPNREFEVRLGSTIRGTDGSAEVNSPVSGANFTPENGYVKINFRGTAPANADSIVLKIYNNHLASQQLRALPTRQNAGNKNGAFSSLQRLRLPPGLYYFTLERQADEELIFVGKFIVEAR